MSKTSQSLHLSHARRETLPLPAGNAARRCWQLWHRWHIVFCNLQNLKCRFENESNSLFLAPSFVVPALSELIIRALALNSANPAGQFNAAKSEPLPTYFPQNQERNENDVRFNASACNSMQHPTPDFDSTESLRWMCLYHFHITAALYSFQD